MLNTSPISSPVVSGNTVMQSRQEIMLLDYVERLQRYRDDRCAIHLHLCALQPHNRIRSRIRITANLFERLLKKFVGQIFELENGDIILVLKEASFEEINECVAKIRTLFRNDPLVRPPESGVGDALCTWYNLTTEFGALLEVCKDFVAAETYDESVLPESTPGLDTEEVAALQTRLESLDLSSFLRPHQVCAVTPGHAAKLAFTELRISINDLITRLWPGVDPLKNRWLFLYLNELLAQRLFEILPGNKLIPNAGAYGVHLNTASLISEEFMRLDPSLRQNPKQTIMIVLQLVDVYADLSTYQFARDFARQRGYHICLDGLGHDNIHLIDRARLGATLIKLSWRSNMEFDLRGKAGRVLRDSIKRSGKERVILGGCEAKRAVEVGWSMGITMFEGPYIDNMLASNTVLRLPKKAASWHPADGALYAPSNPVSPNLNHSLGECFDRIR